MKEEKGRVREGGMERVESRKRRNGDKMVQRLQASVLWSKFWTKPCSPGFKEHEWLTWILLVDHSYLTLVPRMKESR